MHQAAAKADERAMTDARTPLLLGILLVLEAAILLVPGHLAIDAHEVDVLHGVTAVMRLVAGERQHLDFLTPLGPFAFAPTAWFVEAGMGIARASIAASLLVAVVLFPAILRVANSRFGPVAGLAFGAYLIVLATAVVYGGDQANVSLSMAYNRWGWAAVAVIVVLALVPPRPGRAAPLVDGTIIGLSLGYLALLKMTFFVAFAPIVALALVMRRDFRALAAMVASGVAMAALATFLFGGVAFWQAYLGDLLVVQAAEVRPRPGLEWRSLLASPAHFPTVICLLAAVMALRVGGARDAGLLLLLLLPGFVFATYQNWGNDPKWLAIVGFLALAFRPHLAGSRVFGTDGAGLLAMIATASFVLVSPSIGNLAISPLRNATASADDYLPMLVDPRHAGLWIQRERSYNAEGTIDLPPLPDPDADPQDENPHAPFVLGGVEMPRCVMTTGYFGKLLWTARRLAETGHAGEALLYVDVSNPLPLIGDFPRIPDEAPWYYGGTNGMAAADFVVVPTCGTSNVTAKAYIAALDAAADWRLVAREDHYLLFRQMR